MGANDKMTPHDYATAKALVVELQKENALLQERFVALQQALESAQGTICGEFCVGDSHAPACVAINRVLGAR